MAKSELDFYGGVEIGGVSQWLYIRCADPSNPILLFIHGGPGVCESMFFHMYSRFLENQFTIVHWDQRGVNRSFSDKLDPNSLTIEQLISDARQVTEYVLKRFQTNRLNIVVHSAGHFFALPLFTQHPELFSSLFGLGPCVDWKVCASQSYNASMALAKLRNLPDIVENLETLGPPPYDNFSDRIYVAVVNALGGNFGMDFQEVLKIIDKAPVEFKPVIEFREMANFSDQCLREELDGFNLFDHVKETDVPAYLISGKNDLMAPTSQAEDLFKSNIFKGKKELHLFENCAHWPHHEQPEKFATLLREKILGNL